MFTLELSEKELHCLESFILSHNEPCKDCDPDTSCGLYKRGQCIAKNMEAILIKLRKSN